MEYSLIEKCEEWGISDKVLFLGVRTDISELMMSMDVFLLPSLYEGMPFVVVEAQASGLPCVISENVPAPNLTGRVRIVPLTKENKKWAEELLSFEDFLREDATEMVINGNYDISHEARKLQHFYLQNS